MKLLNKLKKLMGYAFALTVAAVSVEKVQAQGAGSAISFAGTSNVSLGDSLSKALGNADFTIEMWVKIRSNSSDPVFIGNKNWASGSNTGFAWARYTTANTIRFNFRANGRTRKDYNMALEHTKWNHVAITVKRNGIINGYVNGKQNGTPVSIAADSGYTLDAALPVRLGSDGFATNMINGDLDEVRIWSGIRTEEEIRNNMCQKVAGASTGLMAYYRMDETSTTTLSNTATASAGNFDGTFVNNPLRVASGAAVGDTAVNLYAASYAGQVLNLGSTANGNVQLSGIGDAMGGVQIYRTNAVPNSTTGISNPGTNNVYYGVFPVNDTASYTVSYDYTNYPAANTFEGGIDLFRRYSLDSTWGLWGAVKNATANTLTKTATQKRSEIIIGSFVTSITCNTPTALSVPATTTNTASLSWTTGGSNAWNIAYGTGTFTPGAGGTTIHNVTSANYTLSNLQPATTYQYYVQDTCAPINSSSAWAGPFTFTTATDYATYGSGYGINFQGTAANEHVNLGDSLSAALATTNFTVETWIKFNNNTSDPAFIGNKNWDNGQNTGLLWCWNGNNNLRFNFKPVGGVRRDYDINVPNPSKWNHIAMVVDRYGNMTAYLNGVHAGTPINIVADTGKSIDGVLPIRIGQDGTGTYSQKFKGAMDELKIWSKALTPEEIRANMCMKMDGSQANLLAYYRMNEASGNLLTNNAAATATVFNGTLLNNPQRVVSGAAIGDTSIYIYPLDWNGISTALNSNAQGSLTIDSVQANTKGIHIYRLNTVPNYVDGIVQPGTTTQYFGVFSAGNLNATYRMKYNYSNYPNAVANNSQLHVYTRPDNAATSWIQSTANNDIGTNTMSAYQALGARQYLLADFAAAACPTPTNVTVSNVDTGNANINWTSTAAGHIIELGPQSFTPGTGTLIAATGSPMALTNLNASTAYEFYLRDSCSATGKSAWVGPFTFSTLNPCPQPFNITGDSITTSSIVVKWENNGVVTQDYIVSWGAQGFGNPAFGIQDNVTDKRFQLNGATVNTAYDFYIRANCNSSVSNSGWAGPFTFSTIACDVPAALNITGITTDAAKVHWSSTAAQHRLTYGPAGFTIGTGIAVDNLTDTAYQLTGLSAATVYDVYVQDSCSETLGSSVWAGPITFTTNAATSINTISGHYDFNVFPNPAKDKITLSLPKGTRNAIVTIKNSLGATLYVQTAVNERAEISTSSLTPGMYFLTVNDTTGNATRKIVIKR
ncbi:MAG: T9SS type A sorting domain-containing protein [Sphingobacteriales bacterium]|nr:MAG: T9SS type A sorting domain-containing protein [Sphingobacteriales bacterium]